MLAGGTLLASLAPGALWLFPIVILMGIGNGVFHPCDFAILNANVATRRLGHAYSAHGVGRQPRLCVGADRELRARHRVRLARRARRDGRGRASSCSAVLVFAARAPHVASRRRCARHTIRGSLDLFLQPAILAVLRLLRPADRGDGGPADVPAVGAQCGPVGAAHRGDLGGHRVSPGRHRGHRRRRLPRHAHVAARHRRRRRARVRGRAAGDRGICATCRSWRSCRCSCSSGFCDRQHGPVARPHRAQRHAQGRGGPRVRLRLFGPRPRGDDRPHRGSATCSTTARDARCSTRSPCCWCSPCSRWRASDAR